MVLAPLYQGCPWIGKDELSSYEQNQNIYEARQVLEQAATFSSADMRRSRPACEWAISSTCRGSCHCRLPRRHGPAEACVRALAVTATRGAPGNARDRKSVVKGKGA